jgi:class 3 adenylate cyclase
MSQTRRLAAILAADVAGYSRLIGTDEEGTLNRLRSIRADVIHPKITKNRGRIVKTTGDGMLAQSLTRNLRLAFGGKYSITRAAEFATVLRTGFGSASGKRHEHNSLPDRVWQSRAAKRTIAGGHRRGRFGAQDQRAVGQDAPA